MGPFIICTDELTVAKLVKSHLFWEPKIHYRVNSSPALDAILNHINEVHFLSPSLLKIHPDIILAI